MGGKPKLVPAPKTAIARSKIRHEFRRSSGLLGDCKESIRDSGREGHESSKAESDPRRGMRGQLTRKQRDEPSKALDAQEAAAKKRLPQAARRPATQ